jgi:hypothetical protein
MNKPVESQFSTDDAPPPLVGPGTITFALENGDHMTLPSFIVGELIVHPKPRVIVGDMRITWQITHAPTGRLILETPNIPDAQEFKTSMEGIAFASVLQMNMAWADVFQEPNITRAATLVFKLTLQVWKDLTL